MDAKRTGLLLALSEWLERMKFDRKSRFRAEMDKHARISAVYTQEVLINPGMSCERRSRWRC